MNTLLLRQFIVRSVAPLLALSLGLLAAIHSRRLAIGALMGGGWMIANCAAIVWTGTKALKHSDAQRGRYVLGFIAAILGSLVVGGWLAMTFRPAPLGLTIGVSIPLVVFLLQLRSLKLTLGSDAR